MQSNNVPSDKMTFLHMVSHIVLAILVLGEIILAIKLYNKEAIGSIRIIGWITLVISGVFGWLPILEFRRKGGVPKKQSFVKTTKLVESGIYAIVRHPQFLGGILFGLSFILIAQHWSVLIVGMLVMVFFYIGVIEGDSSAVEKFGDEYKRYMQEVPRINFVNGIVRLMRKKK